MTLVSCVWKVLVGLVVLQLGRVQVIGVPLWILVKDERELEDAPVEVEDGGDAVANAGTGQHGLICKICRILIIEFN